MKNEANRTNYKEPLSQCYLWKATTRVMKKTITCTQSYWLAWEHLFLFQTQCILLVLLRHICVMDYLVNSSTKSFLTGNGWGHSPAVFHGSCRSSLCISSGKSFAGHGGQMRVEADLDMSLHYVGITLFPSIPVWVRLMTLSHRVDKHPATTSPGGVRLLS